jgi:PST family polysaccharide transporter
MNYKKILSAGKRTVLANIFSLSTLQGINYILPLIVLPYLIRVIGPAKFGLIAFAQALTQYFMILTDYGFSLTATRNISLCRAHKEKMCDVFSSVMTVKSILTALSFIILILIVRFIPKFRQDWLIYVISFGAVIGTTLFPVWFFQGHEKMKYISMININGGIIYAICIFVFVRKPADFMLVPLLNSLFFLITGLLGLFVAFRKFELTFIRQTYADIKEELRTGWDIFISIVAINAYTSTRVFAVGLLTNNILTGYYAVAERIANAIQTFPLDAFSQALYPRISKIFTRSRKRAARIMNAVQTSFIFSYLVVIPLAYYSAPWITRIACGVAYPEVIITLQLLLLAVFCIIANAFRVQFLLVCGKPEIYSRIHVIAAIIGLPLIFILIYYFSYAGAALSTIILEVGIYIATFEIIRKLSKKRYA